MLAWLIGIARERTHHDPRVSPGLVGLRQRPGKRVHPHRRFNETPGRSTPSMRSSLMLQASRFIEGQPELRWHLDSNDSGMMLTTRWRLAADDQLPADHRRVRAIPVPPMLSWITTRSAPGSRHRRGSTCGRRAADRARYIERGVSTCRSIPTSPGPRATVNDRTPAPTCSIADGAIADRVILLDVGF